MRRINDEVVLKLKNLLLKSKRLVEETKSWIAVLLQFVCNILRHSFWVEWMSESFSPTLSNNNFYFIFYNKDVQIYPINFKDK